MIVQAGDEGDLDESGGRGDREDECVLHSCLISSKSNGPVETIHVIDAIN